MNKVRKFGFDRSFDPLTPAQIARLRSLEEIRRRTAEEAAKVQIEEPPEPTYSQAELDAAVASATLAGRAEGESAALAGVEQRAAQTLEALVTGLAALRAAQIEEMKRIERQAARLVLACLRHLFPVLLKTAGAAEIEPLIRRAVGQCVTAPRLVLRCSETQSARLEALLRAAAEQAGFEGRLILRAEAAMGDADCRMEWGEGGIERDTQALWSEIAELLGAATDDPAEIDLTPADAGAQQTSGSTEEPAEPAPQPVLEESVG